MTTTRFIKDLRKMIPAAGMQDTLRSFRQDPLIWKEFNRPEIMEKVFTDWQQEGADLTPSNLALFLLNPSLVGKKSGSINPSNELLESSILDYEDYLHGKNPVSSLKMAAEYALALYEKIQQGADWTTILKEIASQQGLTQVQDWIKFWGPVFVLINGWLDDKIAFYEGILNIKQQPDFAFALLQHILLGQPDGEDLARLLKNTLAGLPVSNQVKFIQQLRLGGHADLAKITAHGLLERYLVGDFEAKSAAEIWQNSEKFLVKANYYRELASLAQFAQEFETAEKLLKLSEQNLAAELSGVQIQTLALKKESGADSIDFNPVFPQTLRDDPDIQNELVMVSEDYTRSSEISSEPFADLLNADAIYKAGNETLAKQISAEAIQKLAAKNSGNLLRIKAERALNWNPRRLLDQLIELGLWSEARKLNDELTASDPLDAELAKKSVKISSALSDQKGVITGLETLAMLNPDDSDIVRELANAYESSADWQNAFDAFGSLVNDQNSTDPEDMLGYSQSALKLEDVGTATNFAQKVLEQSPENGRALAILGYAHHKVGDSEKALEYLDRSVVSAPDSIEPWLLIAELNREKGELGKSIEVLQTARRTFPTSEKIRTELAKELLKAGQASEALAVLKENEKGNISDLESSLLQIKAEKQLNLPELTDLIERTYRNYPDNPEAAYEYASLKLQKGSAEECAQLLQPLINQETIPEEYKLTFADAVIGEDYRNVHSFDLPSGERSQAAKTVLSEVLSTSPENNYAKVLAGELAIKEGQTEKAFEFISNLLKESSTENSTLFDRIKAVFAWAASILEKFDLALAAVQGVVEAHPDWAAARQTLAEIMQSTGDIAGAVDQANQVLEIAPNVVQSAEWFGSFMNSLGKGEEAEKSIQELAATHKDKLPLTLTLAEMKLAKGEIGESKALGENLKHMLPREKRDSELIRAAKLFDQLDDPEDVEELLRLRIANHQTEPSISMTDLAGFQREKGNLSGTLQTLHEEEDSLGKQSWLDLLKAETLHASGNADEALEVINSISNESSFSPDVTQLAFLPKNWKAFLSENPAVDSLERALAFESANYEKVLAIPTSKNFDVMSKLNRIEADYALGLGKETLPYLDIQVNDEMIYSDPTLAAEVFDTLAEADQYPKASAILMQAVSRYPEDSMLKGCSARLAAVNGDWCAAEDLFTAVDFGGDEAKILEAKTVCQMRNMIKAAVALNRWPEALSLSSHLANAQPQNFSVKKIRLEVLAKGLEFYVQNQNLALKQHIFSPESIGKAKEDLNALTANLENRQEEEISHLCARARVVLDPSQANIRKLALLTPEAEDIVSMMVALDRSGQKQTAVQLGKKHEDKAGVLYEEALCLEDEDPQKALEAMDKIWKTQQVAPWMYALGSQINQKRGEAYSAINQIEEGLQYWPMETGWHLAAVQCWSTVGDGQNVVEHLEKAFELEPEDVSIQLALGKAYLQQKNIEKAIENLQSLGKKIPNQYELWEALAEAYYHAGQEDQALEAAQSAAKINEFSVKPYLISARINLGKGNNVEALDQAQKAVEQENENPDSLLVLAKSWLANSNKLQALQTLEKIPQLKNTTPTILVEHARLIAEINGAANSRGMLESLAERYPDNVEVLNMLAEAQLAAGDKSGAEKSAQQSIKLQSQQPNMQRLLGKIEFESGHLDQAIHNLSQAINQAPHNMESYLELSKVYESQRDYLSAMNILNSAIDVDPRNVGSLIAAAALMRNAKDYRRAENYLRKAAEISPNDLSIRRQLGAVIALNLVESSQEASSRI